MPLKVNGLVLKRKCEFLEKLRVCVSVWRETVKSKMKRDSLSFISTTAVCAPDNALVSLENVYIDLNGFVMCVS